MPPSSLLLIPHDHCYLWQSHQLGLHLIPDALIGISYYSISCTLFYFLRTRKDLPFASTFWLFGVFIVLSGTAHWLTIWTLWYPDYGVSEAVKGLTAVISVYTALQLILVLSQASGWPRSVQLEHMNQQLQLEINERKQVEETLRKLSTRLSLALDSAAIGIWEWDIPQNYLEWDDRMYQLFDTQPEQFNHIYEGWANAVHPDDRAAAETRLQQFMDGEQDFDTEFRIVHSNGNIRFIKAHALVQYDDQGTPQKLIGTNYDISALKEAEQQLQQLNQALEAKVLERTAEVRAGEAQLRDFFDNATDLIQSISPSGEILFVNRAWQETLGYQGAELENLSIFAIIHPEEQAHCQQVLEALLAGGLVTALETRLVTKGGDVITVEGNVNCRFENGQPVATRGIFHDITERKRAELALRSKTEELNRFFSLALDLLCIADTDGYFLRLNRQWEKTLGYPLSKLEGHRFLDYVHPEDMQTTLEAIARQAAGQEVTGFVNRYRCADNSYRWIEWRSTPDGSLIYAAARDITERKQAEEKIRQYTAQLEASNQELEAFAYSVAHDLRAPLRAINAYSHILLEEYESLFDASATNYFNRIRKNTTQMSLLINDLLMLSRVSREAIHYAPVNLSHLADAVLYDLQLAEPERAVEITIAPDIIVAADVTLMRVVLSNLLQNAWKFTHHRAIARIEFGMLKRAEQMVYFVQDDGAGFDMAYASKLFGVFQRLHSAQEYPGTGIGLAMAKRAIHRHGGDIWAEGAVEKGATFYFTVPGTAPETLLRTGT